MTWPCPSPFGSQSSIMSGGHIFSQSLASALDASFLLGCVMDEVMAPPLQGLHSLPRRQEQWRRPLSQLFYPLSVQTLFRDEYPPGTNGNASLCVYLAPIMATEVCPVCEHQSCAVSKVIGHLHIWKICKLQWMTIFLAGPWDNYAGVRESPTGSPNH